MSTALFFKLIHTIRQFQTAGIFHTSYNPLRKSPLLPVSTLNSHVLVFRAFILMSFFFISYYRAGTPSQEEPLSDICKWPVFV